MPAETAVDSAAPALLTMALIRRHYVPAGQRTLHRWVSSGAFPKADISIGGKIRYWRRETIERWIAAQVEGGWAMKVYEKAPAANRGGYQNQQPTRYAAMPRSAIGDWLNPRRRRNAEMLADYLWWHGSKLYLTPEKYSDLADEIRLNAYEVDAAADDLHRLGCINISVAGETAVFTLLDANLDRWAGPAGNGRRQ